MTKVRLFDVHWAMKDVSVQFSASAVREDGAATASEPKLGGGVFRFGPHAGPGPEAWVIC